MHTEHQRSYEIPKQSNVGKLVLPKNLIRTKTRHPHRILRPGQFHLQSYISQRNRNNICEEDIVNVKILQKNHKIAISSETIFSV